MINAKILKSDYNDETNLYNVVGSFYTDVLIRNKLFVRNNLPKLEYAQEQPKNNF